MQIATRNPLKKNLLAVLVMALVAGPALAQGGPAQPDVAEVVAYLVAGVATLALIGNAKLIVRGAMAVFRWAASMIR
jgi:hypothetical protein